MDKEILKHITHKEYRELLWRKKINNRFGFNISKIGNEILNAIEKELSFHSVFHGKDFRLTAPSKSSNSDIGLQ